MGWGLHAVEFFAHDQARLLKIKISCRSHCMEEKERECSTNEYTGKFPEKISWSERPIAGSTPPTLTSHSQQRILACHNEICISVILCMVKLLPRASISLIKKGHHNERRRWIRTSDGGIKLNFVCVSGQCWRPC